MVHMRIVQPAICLVLICSFFLLPSSFIYAYSGSNTFTESLTTTGVVSTPTVPANLAALPVSDTEIDLSWSASTDDLYGISGYRIFRDGNFLATTTALTYADTGLIASTTYAYTVEAFDSILDFSGQSAPVSATTLETPPPPPPPQPGPTGSTGGASSGSTQMRIYNVTVDPALHQATVSFSTNVAARAQIAWGKGADYEGGTLMSPFYEMDHQLQIGGIDPATSYLLKITATNGQGVSVSADASFTTPALPSENPFPNPSAFKATPYADRVGLSWNNPRDPRFTQVRIVRSESFFPRDQFDGQPVYEGAASNFNDKNVTTGHTYYYAIFSEGFGGLYSSGALAEARVPLSGQQAASTAFDPFANLPNAKAVDPAIAALSLSDFDFIQEGKPLALVNDRTVAIDGLEDLTIRLPYGKVPEVLKTIAVTLQDPQDPTAVFPFLLRVNADKTYYEATIGSLGHSGRYALNVAVLDFQNMGLKRLQGDLYALAFQAPILHGGNYDPMAFLLLAILGLCILAALLFARRRAGQNPTFALNTP